MSDSTSRTDLYRFFDVHDVLLYVGISLNAAQRASQHRTDKHWWPEVHRMEVEHLVCDRGAAIVIERNAILNEAPLYNVMHNTPIMLSLGDGPIAFDALVDLGITDAVGMGWPYGRFDAAVLLNDIAKAMNNLARNLGQMERDVDKTPITRQAFLDTLNAIARSIIYGSCCDNNACPTWPCGDPMFPIAITIEGNWAKCHYICQHCMTSSSCGWTTDLDILASIG